MNNYNTLTQGSLAVLLVCGFTACEPKATDAAIQAQVTAQVQAKAADDRVAQLEQQVADMKTDKNKTKSIASTASADQETMQPTP